MGAWGSGVRVGVVCGGVTSVVAVIVIGRVWSACDVGGGASANSLSLAVMCPAVWVVVGISWVLVRGLLGRIHPGAALLVGVLLNAWLLWFSVAWLGVLDSYPDPICPGNVPSWWPRFIPA